MKNYLINSRVFTLNQEITQELLFAPEKNYLFDLSYLGIIDIEGNKSEEFLQGQASSDIKKVNDQAMFPGAFCNLKGRIVSLFQACKYEGLKLILPQDLLKDTIKSLQTAAMLSRVQMHVNTDLSVLGYYSQNNDLIPAKDLPCLKLYSPENQNNLFLILVNKEDKDRLIEEFTAKNQYKGSLAWHTLTLLHKVINIYPETMGELLPHRLDLQLTEYLNFEKGCYKGQEIIARTHYRATLKHELSLFTMEPEIALYSGQKITEVGKKQEIGEVIDYSPINEKEFIIAASVLKDRPLELELQ